PKLPFRADAAEEAGLIYKKKSVLFVEGGKDDFLAVFDWQRPGLATWDFWLDVAAMQDGRQKSWLKWIFRLCAELPPMYGFGCSVAEHDAKHEMVKVFEGGKTVTSA